MSVTVASTTDSEEDVKVAAGLPVEVEETKEEALSEEGETSEEAESDSAETEESEKDSKSAAASEAAEEEEDEEPEERAKPSSKVQKRIDKLTEEKYELRDQNRELRDRLDRLEALVSKAEPQTEEVHEDKKPLRHQYKTDDEYFESLGRWSARDEARKNEATAEQARSNEELAVVFENYNEGAATFKAENPDYDKVVGDSKLKIPMAVQTAIITYEQDGPAIAYYLAKNPEVVSKLREMNHTRAVAEIGRIHSKLYPDVEESEEKKEPPKTQVKKPVRQAAAPIKPTKAAGTNSTVNLDELPYSDYRRIRDQQERGRIRR